MQIELFWFWVEVVKMPYVGDPGGMGIGRVACLHLQKYLSVMFSTGLMCKAHSDGHAPSPGNSLVS